MLDDMALEQMYYQQFRRSYLIYRLNDVGMRYVDLDDPSLALPMGSTFHVVDRLYEENPSLFPDSENPFIKNEENIRYMGHVTHIPKDGNFAVDKDVGYRFMEASFRSDLLKFFKNNTHIKRLINFEAAMGRKKALIIFNYNPILQARVHGKFKSYKKFSLIIASLLENIAILDKDYPSKLHFIEIPLSTNIFTKSRYMRTFNGFNNQSIRNNDSEDFFFVSHILGYITDSEYSIFMKLDETLADRMHFILSAGNEALMFSLRELKELRGSNSLFYMKILKQIHALKLRAQELLVINPDNDAYEAEVDRLESKEEVEEVPDVKVDPSFPISTEIVEENIPPKSDIPEGDRLDITEERLPPLGHIKRDVERSIVNSDVTLSEYQKARALTQVEKMQDIKIKGRPVIDVMLDDEDPDITDEKVIALKDVIPDDSMLSSTISNYDKLYIEKQLEKDIMSVFTSFAKTGMILQNMDYTDEITEFNKIRHYKLRYQDLTGKRHNLSFKVPLLTKDGELLINGIKSKMIKQQINLPICKVSDYRVNLSSNFNKAIVERVRRQAKRFDISITRYITQLINDNLVMVKFGSIDVTKQNFPYDYACLAMKFSKIRFKDYSLDFDYENRFSSIATEALRETTDLFSYNDKMYDLEKLLNMSDSLPVIDIPLKDLLWNLQFDTVKSDKRLEKVNLEKPIIVMEENGKVVVLDGFHRTSKAYQENLNELPARMIKRDMLDECILSHDQEMDILRSLSDREIERFLNSVYAGTKNGLPIYYGRDNKLRVIDRNSPDVIVLADTIRTIFKENFPSHPPKRMHAEWAELKLQDRFLPVIFVLSYKFGLSRMLATLNHPFRFVNEGRTKIDMDEIVIQFEDGKLIFPRYPLKTSLILAGLDYFKLRNYTFKSMDQKDTYFNILSDNSIRTNYLKGLDGYFNYFIDPLTRDVLERMGETTTPEGLLIRSAEMLSSMDHLPAASMQHHRLRGYERFPAIIYNNLARSLTNLDAQRSIAKRTFSINPEQIMYAIIQDQTLSQTETINPVHDIKQNTLITFTGQGGREGQTMVVRDRTFEDDALGILSESTPDSGKVAVNTHSSVNPAIRNIRGMYMHKNPEELEPANILSVSSLLIPAATQDDSKRIGYISKELSHHVPSMISETMRTRTGFEEVVAHRTTESFAATAARDGIIENIDEDLGLVRIKYDPEKIKIRKNVNISPTNIAINISWKENASITDLLKTAGNFKVGDLVTLNGQPHLFRITEVMHFSSVDEKPSSHASKKVQKEFADKPCVFMRFSPYIKDDTEDVDIFKFGDIFTNASGFHLKQKLVINDLSVGDRFKKDDVLVYNPGFFEPSLGKQVSWKHGIMATVVMMDRSETYEDACQVSASFSEKLGTSAAHMRTIEMTSNTVLHSFTDIGEHVETTDYLMILEDADLDAITSRDDPDTLDILASLNRKMPRAKFHGTISDIEIFHACKFEELHPSLQKLARRINRKKRKVHDTLKNTRKKDQAALPSVVPLGTKYQGITFNDTSQVIMSFIISEDMNASYGDKITLGSTSKSIISSVMEKPSYTESGKDIDVMFSSSGVNDRILTGYKIMGFSEMILEDLEEKAVEIYFS